MITDEQIIQIAEKHGVEINDMSQIRAARELIALALQVKPLEFERDEEGDYVATSEFGRHILYLSFTGKTYRYNNTRYKTLDEAIEAANADYQRRVLSCLVHGAV